MKLWTAVAMLAALPLLGGVTVKTGLGELEGTENSGVRMFKGVPFAKPPVGKLRFAAPEPVEKWDGVREAKQFGPRCMQHPIFGDMNFRSNGMSEDCLYLNIWTPAKSSAEKLPVLVYIFGGGFMAGDGSEPRYDGESMARKGIVSITVNYRLGVFGFLAHPELTAETGRKASGNWALLDQNMALKWVQQNIAAFGGDPKRVTIAGESAGSASVSAQMGSPLSKDLIAGVIGESGAVVARMKNATLQAAEEQGAKFVENLGAKSIAEVRAMETAKIMEATGKQGAPRFQMCIDGYFFPEDPGAIFAAGKQAHVPLLAGWNSEEQGARAVLGQAAPTVENYKKAVEKMYGEDAAAVLKEYAAASDADVVNAARALAGDRFIAYGTWKWLELAAKTGGKPVYRYFYERPRPKMTPEFAGATAGMAGGVIRGGAAAAAAPPRPTGAVHSAEIEYAMGNLASNKVYAWEPEDYAVSKTMQEYFANFVKTGDPNGKGLPKWASMTGSGAVPVMHIDVKTRQEMEAHRGRYEVMDRLNK